MITIGEFLKRWNSKENPLYCFDDSTLDIIQMPCETRNFLTKVGLPKSSPPFLTFHAYSEVELQKITIPSDYLVIGFTGNGDYICIKDKTGEVIIVDHEDNSRNTLMNKSLLQMIEFILEYTEFIERIIAINGDDAYLDSNAPPDMVSQLKKRFIEIDRDAMVEGSFWDEELEQYE